MTPFGGHRKRVTVALTLIGLCFVTNLWMQSYAQVEKRKEAIKKENTFTRPAPTRPIKPEIPDANRFRQDKVFLEYADSLFKTATRDTVQRQVVKGNVKFRQAGMWLFCDSAYYFPELNSLDAFGNVRMEQGDTLFVYSDILFYDGNERMARLKNGVSCPKVKLINKDVTLTTDSLDYDLNAELGWYSQWGTIDDKVNTLTSLYGEYSPATKTADFYHDVVLVNNKDGYTMYTDTLHYNTETHIARIESKTKIQGENDTILTTRGFYDTESGNAELLSRSTLIHRDSTGNVVTLEGDSIIYDNTTRISRAYMFRSPLRHPQPMVLTDTAHKTTLVGGFGLYNDSTQEALATIYPLLMEYSQGDTLFLRADTIKTYIVTEMVATGRRRTLSGYPEYNGVPVVKVDSNGIWIHAPFFMPRNPYEGKEKEMIEAKLPKRPEPEKNKMPELPKKLDPATELATGLEGANSEDSVVNIPGLPPTAPVAPLLKVKPDDAPGKEDDVPATETPVDSLIMVAKDFHVAMAYHRARFFKQDMQGIADSIVVVERDSMLYMFRKPIVWSGERQVVGNRIDVHFNDSTADWALLPEHGFMSEHVGEEFYNQLSGTKMFATFADQTLKSMDVSGNVETIFLPQESDSTFNRLVAAESSYLSITMNKGQLEKLKMWPEVSGTVTPLFLIKKSQLYLPRFRWWETLRPVREWYGDRWHWADDLGEVSDELDLYFLSPSELGEPKSFPASRPQGVGHQNDIGSFPLSEGTGESDDKVSASDNEVKEGDPSEIKEEESSVIKVDETSVKTDDDSNESEEGKGEVVGKEKVVAE